MDDYDPFETNLAAMNTVEELKSVIRDQRRAQIATDKRADLAAKTALDADARIKHFMDNLSLGWKVALGLGAFTSFVLELLANWKSIRG